MYRILLLELLAFTAAIPQLGLASTAYAYVSNISGNNISVVDTASGSVVASISVPVGPDGIAVTPDGTAVYVVCQSANSVAVISTASNSVISTINVGSEPVQVAISPNGALAYVVNQGSNTVSVINTATKSVTATIGLGASPSGLAFSADSSTAYVANAHSGTVSMISTSSNSVTGSFVAGSGPASVALSPNGAFAYVANQYSGTVTVHALPSGMIVATINGLSYPNCLAMEPNGTNVFVTNGDSGSVSVISTAANKITATISTAALPVSVAMSSDGAEAYVVNENGFSLSIINTSNFQVTNTIARVGVYPIAVATVPAPVTGPTCSYAISPGSASFGSNGGSGSVSVTAPPGCSWSAVSNMGAVSITAGSGGTGDGSVSYSVSSNQTQGTQSGSLNIAGQTFSITQTGIGCSYSLSSAGVALGNTGGGGTVTVTAPYGCLWKAASNSGFLSVTSGASGSGTETVNYLAMANSGSTSETGTLTIAGQIFTVEESGSACSSKTPPCAGTVPLSFGSIDTPLNNSSGIVGAIGFTGWALSAAGMGTVGVWREPVAGESVNGLVFIGNAEIISGLRPDVAKAFPTYPSSNSGWGFEVLTNELPNANGKPGQGNGTYRFHVLATDTTGQVTDLGIRTLTTDNTDSVLPFGTIDTPVQGGTASGNAYVNFGWVLTPNPNNLIPINGSSIWVFVDNLPVGHPVYDNYRFDIATLFPGLQNSQGAVGYYYVDTTKLTNGLHTIAWSAKDSAGNLQGIGSRYFNVQN